jgi:catechol 2,3-dioxygenase-like lactoylglutathione lyase family enzyme
MKFEVAVIPVADVDRSKEFYTKLGWRLDADFPFDNGFRLFSSRRLAPGARFSLARR